ncbi:MAG: esterase [Lachnospiraceae bacterium]|nr:esterase [Lachnospiraceae bacterium]
MKETTFTLKNRTCVFHGQEDPAYLFILPMDGGEMKELPAFLGYMEQASHPAFALVAFMIGDWNKELSPWDAPAVFGRESFGHGAAETLAFVTEDLVPYVAALADLPTDIKLVLGGYSLAALFSLWSSYQTDAFYAVSAASPSVWFQGWRDYIGAKECLAERVYLSLGDKEDKTKNQVMKTVGENIVRQYECLQKQSVTCILEYNEGNHFRDAIKRSARGFAWSVTEEP